jgi:hypothetical protein
VKIESPITEREPNKQFTFVVPDEQLPGSYVVSVSFGKPPNRVDGPFLVPIPGAAQRNRLHVLSAAPEKLKLTAISPLVSYPDRRHFRFRLLGEGFGPLLQDNKLLLEGVGELPVEWTRDPPGRDTDKIYGRVDDSSRQLEIWGLPQSEYYGRLRFRVRFGEAVSDPVEGTFAGACRFAPLVWSCVVIFGLALVFWIAIWWTVTPHQVVKKTYGAVTSLFLDKETDTYSLSKLQLYLWTGVAVFGYVYLTLARCLIQWRIELPPIPENLPGILLVSAGTTVGAKGITTVRGPKGAGEVYPSLSDFITAGGVVVAERFQFLVWTVLGVASFLFVIVISDPASLLELPKVPEGFLYLMGISSAGYLGGKLARKPGPIIDSIAARRGSASLVIKGRNLSRDGGFKIDDKEVSVRLKPSATAPAPPPADADLEVVQRDPTVSQPDFATELLLTVTDPAAWLTARGATGADVGAWLTTGPHTLTLTNPDGQKAAMPIEVAT